MRNNVAVLCAMAVLALAGMADAQGPGGRGRGVGGGVRGGLFSLTANEAVLKDLALSSDAAAKVKEVGEEFTKEIRDAAGDFGNFREMSREERTKAGEKAQAAGKAATEKLLPKLKAALTAEQFTRLQQINWQVMGSAAFADAEIVKALAITADQQEKIKTANDDFNSKLREVFSGGGGGGDGRERFGELNKERETKVEAALTKDQLDKFATLKGASFDVTQVRRGPGGPGGGGPGGGGPGGGARGKRPQPKAE